MGIEGRCGRRAYFIIIWAFSVCAVLGQPSVPAQTLMISLSNPHHFGTDLKSGNERNTYVTTQTDNLTIVVRIITS